MVVGMVVSAVLAAALHVIVLAVAPFLVASVGSVQLVFVPGLLPVLVALPIAALEAWLVPGSLLMMVGTPAVVMVWPVLVLVTAAV